MNPAVDSTVFPISPRQVLDVCRATLEQYGAGAIEAWPRRESSSDRYSLELYMPARIGEWDGLKTIQEERSTAPGRLGERIATMNVCNRATGESWTFPADRLTDSRTGAAGVLAAEFLAPPEVTSAAIVGAGRVARAIAIHLDEAALAPGSPLGTLKEIRIASRSLDGRTACVRYLSPRLRLPARAVTTVEEAVDGAEIIFLAAATAAPILKSVSPGVQVTSLSGSPTSAALYPRVILEADTVVVDQWDQCQRSGEMAEALRMRDEELLPLARIAGRIAHLGDAALGRVHRKPRDRTIAYLSGLALLDLGVAIELIKQGFVPVQSNDTSIASQLREASWQPTL